VNVSFDGREWEQLADNIGAAPARIQTKAQQGLDKIGADGTREAQAFAPVDTGNLRGGIDWTRIGLEVEFGAHADYAPYVEDGTSTMAPQAFVGPAFDRQQPVFIAMTEALAAEVIR
jgi:HK97 gp10 family phage protein